MSFKSREPPDLNAVPVEHHNTGGPKHVLNTKLCIAHPSLAHHQDGASTQQETHTTPSHTMHSLPSRNTHTCAFLMRCNVGHTCYRVFCLSGPPMNSNCNNDLMLQTGLCKRLTSRSVLPQCSVAGLQAFEYKPASASDRM